MKVKILFYLFRHLFKRKNNLLPLSIVLYALCFFSFHHFYKIRIFMMTNY
jgi:hypothetical protein